MIPISPSHKTTLVLTAAFNPCGFFTARSAIRNLIVGGVKAYDRNANIHDWHSWIANDDHLSEDHPCLRSVDSEWAIPTIVIIPGYFGTGKNRKRRNRTINLKQLYSVYSGVCQYCLKEIPFSVATRDHVIPRSKGGDNMDTNIVLSCKKCNSKKSNKMPYHNVRGCEVTPRILNDIEFSALSEKVIMLEEWKQFLPN